MVFLHRRTSHPGQPSVVLRYFLQQKEIPPRSPYDSVWRLIILPLAIVRFLSLLSLLLF
jgi:hypothetical protein